MTSLSPPNSRTKLLDAAIITIRAKGYAATTVDDVCAAAGVTKGSFFHHFKSKDELASATVQHFSTGAEALFAAAPYHLAPDPLDRLLGYVDFRSSNLTGEIYEYTCLFGTLIQETYASHPAIRAACDRGLSAHVAAMIPDIEVAKHRYAPSAAWSAESLGTFIQAVVQGSFIHAKAKTARRWPATIWSTCDLPSKPGSPGLTAKIPPKPISYERTSPCAQRAFQVLRWWSEQQPASLDLPLCCSTDSDISEKLIKPAKRR